MSFTVRRMEENKLVKTPLQASIVVSLLAFLDALYLLYMELSGNFKCLINQGIFQCETVNSSPYAKFLGVHVSLWGVIFYLIFITLLFLALFSNNEYWLSFFLPVASLWGLGFSIYLTSIEIFKIKFFCEFCLFSAICSVILFVLVLISKKKYFTSLIAKLDFWNMFK